MAHSLSAPSVRSGGASWSVPDVLIRMLGRVRQNLGMEIAFIAEFTGGRRVFRYVDAGTSDLQILEGNSDPLDDSFCLRVADGRLPQLMTDACRNAEALKLPVTQALPVGAHLSVPVKLSDGHIFGTICCFSRHADESLQDHDLDTLRMIADVMAEYFEQGLALSEFTSEERR